MLRVSRLADYAITVALRLASGDMVQTSSGIAGATGVPEPTVAKLLKMLSSAGLAASLRGARGGYRLARPLSGISIADVIAAVDGPIAIIACVEGAASVCDMGDRCALSGRWGLVNDAVRGALDSISLAALRAAPVRAGRAQAMHPTAGALPAE